MAGQEERKSVRRTRQKSMKYALLGAGVALFLPLLTPVFAAPSDAQNEPFGFQEGKWIDPARFDDDNSSDDEKAVQFEMPQAPNGKWKSLDQLGNPSLHEDEKEQKLFFDFLPSPAGKEKTEPPAPAVLPISGTSLPSDHGANFDPFPSAELVDDPGRWVDLDAVKNETEFWSRLKESGEQKSESENREISSLLSPPVMPSESLWRQIQTASDSGPTKELSNDADYWFNLDEVRDGNMFTTSGEGEENDLHVRYAPLPSPNVNAVFDVRISKPKLETENAARRAREKAESKRKDEEEKVSSEACEALAVMRKRQLEAIESDKRTLSELRQALKDLGLTKTLSFMTDGAKPFPSMPDADTAALPENAGPMTP